MADESKVLVKLRLLGGQLMARDAKRAAGGLKEIDRGGRAAAKGLGTIRGGRVQSQLTRVQRATVGVRKGLSGVVGAAGAAGRALRGLGVGAVVGVAAGIAAIGRQTIGFDESMRNVNSIAQLSEKSLGRLAGRVRELGGQTAQQPKVLAEGLYDLVSSGFDADQSMLILRSSARAASAGLTDTATSTKAVAAVLNAYHRPASDAANVSDTLFQTVNKGVISFEQLSSTIGDVLPFASSLGVGLDQVGASVSTLTKAGISPEETMTRIKNVMVSLIKPGEGLSKAFKGLGVSSGEALIKQKGFQGALEAIISTTDGSKAAVAKLFPNIRSLGGALALTGKNAKGARDDLASFRDVNGATSKALSQQSKSVAFQWRKLKAQASSLAIGIGATLIPAALKGANALGKVLGSGGPVAKFMAGVTGKRAAPTSAVGERAQGAAAARGRPHGAERAGLGLRGALSPVIAWARKELPTVGALVVKVGAQLVDAFKPAVPFVTNVLLPLLKGIAIGVIGSIVVAFRVAVPIIKIVATVLGLVGKAAAPFRGVIEGIGVAVGIVFGPALLGRAAALLGKLASEAGFILTPALRLAQGALVALTAPVRIAGAGVRLLARTIGLLARGFGRAFTFVSRFAGTLQGGARRAAVGAVNMVGGIIRVIERLPGRAASLAGRLVSRLTSRLGSSVGRVASAAGKLGKGLVDGAVNAIKGAPGAIADALLSLVPGPVNGVVKSVLGLVTGHAGGGVVRSPLQVVGEHGPELVAQPIGSRVVPAGETRRMLRPPQTSTVMAARPVIVVHVHPNDLVVDGKVLHSATYKVERKIAEAR